ncbi:DoxX family protein [Melghirimyces algeriensis]|uniref:Uncharacterized membrane protein YphA, DoxX/SURF4 family n=1 Tax=Melghirimyces algeriensis TaxID=910412 RepID=A0A521BPT6_9BACL|nr:DoxX family protein [Melghirimyces algeriensis]SMO49156.1 Uncharacterized membrane protein YphA, DoxX/SURF4 family [Melghirimyces algeriensis]
MAKKHHIGALILRLFLGVTFFIHGLAKVQGGLSNTVGFFESIGIPGFMAYIVTFIELIGGIAMIVGLGTRIISILFALIMIGAIGTVKFQAGFMGTGQASGYEFDLALLVISIHLMIVNRSMFALDHVLFRSKQDD